MATEERVATTAGLRAWAQGSYATEAAVELLVRAFAGRFASTGWPWVQACDRPGWFWLETDALDTGSGCLSGGERRLLSIVAALAGGPPVPDLAACLAGLDRSHLGLVLAAFAHAGGSHEQSVVSFDDDGVPTVVEPGSLVDWPADDATSVGVA